MYKSETQRDRYWKLPLTEQWTLQQVVNDPSLLKTHFEQEKGPTCKYWGIELAGPRGNRQRISEPALALLRAYPVDALEYVTAQSLLSRAHELFPDSEITFVTNPALLIEQLVQSKVLTPADDSLLSLNQSALERAVYAVITQDMGYF